MDEIFRPKAVTLRDCISIFLLLSCFISSGSALAKNRDFEKNKVHFDHNYSAPFSKSEIAIRYSDFYNDSIYAQGGASITSSFINFLFPTSGKEKRVEFLPYQYWGHKKPQYKEFDWKRFESQHFVFLTYDFDNDPELLKALVRIFEERHEHNSWLYGVDNRIKKKIPVILFRSRSDFEHTHALPTLVPETMGGWTEIQSWNRVIFGFDGEKTMFEHVARHEANHIYHIAIGTRNIPLWFIEGSSETNSIKWDADSETVIRDAYFNNFLFRIKDMWQIYGTWLMYKQGNYIVNYVVDNFGEESLRKIFKGARKTSFDNNIKQNLGIDLKELDNKVFSKLNEDYGPLAATKDDVERSKELSGGKLLAAMGNFYVSGYYKDGRFHIDLNYIDPKWGHVSKRVISDQQIHSESLHVLKSMAFLDEKRLAYVIDIGPCDVIRVMDYSYDRVKREIVLEKPVQFKWDGITTIYDPVFIDNGRLAFVGLKDGYSNIYIYDPIKAILEPLTSDNNFYRGLSYSRERNILVYSREGKRINKPCRYNYDLWMYDISVKTFKKLTETEYNDTYPSISPDGSKIAFQGDKGDVYNIFLYDMATGKIVKATDVKIAAYTPIWRDNNKLYFSSVNRFQPKIYSLTVPTLKIAFSRNLPLAHEKYYKTVSGKLFYDETVRKDTLEEKISFKSVFIIKGQKLYIVDNKREYEVKGFMPYSGGFIVPAEPSELLKWEEKKSEIVFVYSQGKLRRVSRNFHYDKDLDSTVANILKEFVKEKSVMGTWISPDAERIFVLVNNRLSFLKKKGAQSLYLIDVKTADIKELPYKSGLSGIKDKLSKVFFLGNGKSMLSVERTDWRRNVFYEYYLYDDVENRYTNLFSSPLCLDLSYDSRYFMRVLSGDFGKGDITVYDGFENSFKRVLPSNGNLGVINAHFIEGNRIFAALKEKASPHFRILVLDIDGKTLFEKRLGISEGFLFTYARSSDDGSHFALRVKDSRTKTGIQKLYSYQSGEDDLKEVSTDLSYYKDIGIAQNVLYFTGIDFDGLEKLLTYEEGKLGIGYRIDSADYSFETNRLVVGGGEDILSVDLESGNVKKVIDKSFGFDVYGNYLAFSSYVDGYYNIFLYDLSLDRLKRITKSWFNELSPKISQSGIAYTVDEEKRFSIHTRTLDANEIKRVHVEDMDVYNPIWKDGELYFNVSKVKKEDSSQKIPFEKIDTIWSPEPLDYKLIAGKASYGLKPQRFYGGLAFDGSNVVLFLSLTADNIFSDRGIFINTIYKTDYINSTVGFTNLAKGRTYTFYINRIDNDKYGGISFRKAYIIDKYQEFNLFTQLEYQNFVPDEFKGDFVEFPGKTITQYVIKYGAVYAIDTSLGDMHGPMIGAKIMARTEMGVNLRTGEPSNIDANIDFRSYTFLVRRLGLAHRFMAGTSRGNYPTVFFLGGNLSFRGVNFDGLEGNNYWVFSEDFRIPLFDIIGAKFPDPIDIGLGPFFRFFDVRGGLYFDVGQVWFNKNDDIDRILYSMGFFINSPTVFGMILRFSKGFLGQKGYNFWFGANW